MKRLTWDSEFWGIDIFHIDENDSFYQLGLIDNSFDVKDEFLVQALISDNKVKQINLLEQRGFRFIQSKIMLKKTARQITEIDMNNFKQVEKSDLLRYKDKFYDMYAQVSRFEVFPKDRINDFYYTWVINSIDGKMDDKCIGYYAANDLAGFITYQMKNNETKVGLVGVFSPFQNKGISQKLLGYLNNDAVITGFRDVSISTQGKNLNAINAYIKNGFFFDNIMHWYYLKGRK